MFAMHASAPICWHRCLSLLLVLLLAGSHRATALDLDPALDSSSPLPLSSQHWEIRRTANVKTKDKVSSLDWSHFSWSSPNISVAAAVGTDVELIHVYPYTNFYGDDAMGLESHWRMDVGCYMHELTAVQIVTWPKQKDPYSQAFVVAVGSSLECGAGTYTGSSSSSGSAPSPSQVDEMRGKLVFLEARLRPGETKPRIRHVLKVGIGPTSMSLTPDKRILVVSNEGAPSGAGVPHHLTVDPPGSMSILHLHDLFESGIMELHDITQSHVVEVGFDHFIYDPTENVAAAIHGWSPITDMVESNATMGPVPPYTPDPTHTANRIVPKGMKRGRIGVQPEQDFEPESMSFQSASASSVPGPVSVTDWLCYVTLQENNGVAVLNLTSHGWINLVPLGTIDRSTVPFDASDQDGCAGCLRRYPHVHSLPQPDGIAAFRIPSGPSGTDYFMTANEGGAHRSAFYDEYVTLQQLLPSQLDSHVFDEATLAWLNRSDTMGRLLLSRHQGFNASTHQFTSLHSFGSRSVSIYSAHTGERIYDSGALFERMLAEWLPEGFNVDYNYTAIPDARSTNKGCEPQNVRIVELEGVLYAFVLFEIVGGLVMLDLSDVTSPTLVGYVNYRNFGATSSKDAGDVAPSSMSFVPAEVSPIGKRFMLIAFEDTEEVTIYQIERKFNDPWTVEEILLLTLCMGFAAACISWYIMRRARRWRQQKQKQKQKQKQQRQKLEQSEGQSESEPEREKSECLEGSMNGTSKNVNGVKSPKVIVDVHADAAAAKSKFDSVVKLDKKNVDHESSIDIGPAAGPRPGIGQSVQMTALKRSNDGDTVRANSGGKVQPLGFANANANGETNAHAHVHAHAHGDIDGNEADSDHDVALELGMQAPMHMNMNMNTNGSTKQQQQQLLFHESDWTGCPIMRLDNPHGYVTKPMHVHMTTDAKAKKESEGEKKQKQKHKHGAATSTSTSTWRPPSYWAPLNFRRFGPQLFFWCLSGGTHALLLWLFRLLFVDLSLTLFLVFIALSLGEIIFQQLLIWYASRSLICGIEADCRIFVLSHVLTLSPEQTSGSRGLGYACNYLPMVYRDCAQFLVQQVCPSVGSMVTTLLLLAKTSPLYPLPFLLTAVLGMVWTDARQHIIARLRTKKSKTKMEVRNDTQDTMSGLSAIKLQGSEDYEKCRYVRQVSQLRLAESLMADGESIQQSVATILCWLAFAFNLTLAFYIAASPADFMLVFILSANLLRKLSDAMEQLITCLGKWEEVEDLWETVFLPPLPFLTPPLPLSWLPLGQSIGVEGESGAGKSTFVRRLTSGSEKHCAIGSQVSHIFKRSYIENIVYDLPFDGDKFALAVSISQLSEIIGTGTKSKSKSKAERTVPPLSGGQMQRVLCARAIYKCLSLPYSTLVLDEPSSALDVATEQRLFMALKTHVFPQRRVIVVTHRPAVLDMMDRVIHIDKMRITWDRINNTNVNKGMKMNKEAAAVATDLASLVTPPVDEATVMVKQNNHNHTSPPRSSTVTPASVDSVIVRFHMHGRRPPQSACIEPLAEPSQQPLVQCHAGSEAAIRCTPVTGSGSDSDSDSGSDSDAANNVIVARKSSIARPAQVEHHKSRSLSPVFCPSSAPLGPSLTPPSFTSSSDVHAASTSTSLHSFLPDGMLTGLLRLSSLVHDHESEVFQLLEPMVAAHGGYFEDLQHRFKPIPAAIDKLARRCMQAGIRKSNNNTHAHTDKDDDNSNGGNNNSSNGEQQRKNEDGEADAPQSYKDGHDVASPLSVSSESASSSSSSASMSATASNSSNVIPHVCAACGCRDLLRYTVAFPEEKYSSAVRAILAKLNVLSCKNYWMQPSYQGIHVKVAHVASTSTSVAAGSASSSASASASARPRPCADERSFAYEIQFHTPSSLRSKWRTHDLYAERRRLLGVLMAMLEQRSTSEQQHQHEQQSLMSASPTAADHHDGSLDIATRAPPGALDIGEIQAGTLEQAIMKCMKTHCYA